MAHLQSVLSDAGGASVCCSSGVVVVNDDSKEDAAWSAADQAALDAALRATLALSGKARWRRIAELVPGKSATDCVARFKAIRARLLLERRDHRDNDDDDDTGGGGAAAEASPTPPPARDDGVGDASATAAATATTPPDNNHKDAGSNENQRGQGLTVVAPTRRRAPLPPPAAADAQFFSFDAARSRDVSRSDRGDASLSTLVARVKARAPPPADKTVAKKPEQRAADTPPPAPDDFPELRVPKAPPARRRRPREPGAPSYTAALDPTLAPAIRAHLGLRPHVADLYQSNVDDDAAFFWGGDDASSAAPVASSSSSSRRQPKERREVGVATHRVTQASPKGTVATSLNGGGPAVSSQSKKSGSGRNKKPKGPKLKNLAMKFG